MCIRDRFACFSNGEVLPPCGLAVELPASRQRCNHLTAALGLISKCSAASRREAPLSTLAMTRSRSSTEYGFGIVQPPKAESMPTDSPINSPLGIPRFYWEPSDSIRPKHAIVSDTKDI